MQFKEYRYFVGKRTIQHRKNSDMKQITINVSHDINYDLKSVAYFNRLSLVKFITEETVYFFRFYFFKKIKRVRKTSEIENGPFKFHRTNIISC